VTRRTIVIVGASLCGASAAATLREQGFDGPLVLIGEEELPPYERPPLSKEYLRGERPLDAAFVRPPEWYDEQGIDARFGIRAERVDLAERAVVLEGGERIPFDGALIATGARNRRPPFPGLDLEGVYDLRTPSDADRIRTAAAQGGRVAVVGMGFIGSEVAASLRQLGADVAAVDIFDVPLQRALGRQVGTAMEALHRDHGVELHMGDPAVRLEGSGRVDAVVTGGGQRIECDVAVIGLGVEPNVEVALGTGIDVDDGILVGPTLETGAPGVYAAGDVARHRHPLFGLIRVEHFDNAIKMGVTAAANLLGAGQPFEDPHWFWSDQFDANLQVAGVALEWDRLVVRGRQADREFIAFYLRDGRLLQAAGLNRGRDVRRALKLIGRPVDPDALRDEDVDLRTLVSA
jgi:3-phenylpropionate/trans-cinnamate dioxygenase ferredoxin reductase component